MDPTLSPPPDSPWRVPFDGTFRIADARTSPPRDAPSRKDNEERLERSVARLAKLQKKLYADDRFAVLLVFQALDAAGKDGTIRALLTGVNPVGCQVFTFKAPSAEELDHDFLWRVASRLPERGRIGVFNRSHYEEVLVVRVHPEYLGGQKLLLPPDPAQLWQARFESIADLERHLARSGTLVLKFFLNVSRDEQRKRFLDRIDDEDANWKFNARDLAERRHWSAYAQAYEAALGATSRPWAPWYAIPADDKPFMRAEVARIVERAIDGLPLSWPEPTEKERDEMRTLREALAAGEI